MKFTVEFEMEKWHCMECPMLDSNDCCNLQPEYDYDIENTWEELMSNCPLEIVE